MRLPLRTLVLGLAALGVGLSLLLWPRHSSDAGWEAYTHALSVSASRKMAADAKAFRQADSALAQRDGTTTRVIHTYHVIRDTLDIHDTVQVKVFVERADSVVRACTELQSACSIYRVRAESVIADLHVENDALRAAIPKPTGKFSRLFLQMKGPALFVAGVWVGSKVVR